MNEDEIIQGIYELLLQHVGKENAISSREIADAVGFDAGVSMRASREYILKVMRRKNISIAANSNGYYIPRKEEREDVQKYIISLQNRSNQVIERATLVRMRYEEMYGEHLEFGPEENDENFDEEGE